MKFFDAIVRVFKKTSKQSVWNTRHTMTEQYHDIEIWPGKTISLICGKRAGVKTRAGYVEFSTSLLTRIVVPEGVTVDLASTDQGYFCSEKGLTVFLYNGTTEKIIANLSVDSAGYPALAKQPEATAPLIVHVPR